MRANVSWRVCPVFPSSMPLARPNGAPASEVKHFNKYQVIYLHQVIMLEKPIEHPFEVGESPWRLRQHRSYKCIRLQTEIFAFAKDA